MYIHIYICVHSYVLWGKIKITDVCVYVYIDKRNVMITVWC